MDDEYHMKITKSENENQNQIRSLTKKITNNKNKKNQDDFNKNKNHKFLKQLTFFQEKTKSPLLSKPSVLNLKKNFTSNPLTNSSIISYSSNEFSGYEENENEDEEAEEGEEKGDEESEEYEDEEGEYDEYEDEEGEYEEYEDQEEEDEGYESDSSCSFFNSEESLSNSNITKSEISEANEKSLIIGNIYSPKKKTSNKKSDKYSSPTSSPKSKKKSTVKNQKDKVIELQPCPTNTNNQDLEEKRKNSRKISSKKNIKNNFCSLIQKRGCLVEFKEKKRNFIKKHNNKNEKKIKKKKSYKNIQKTIKENNANKLNLKKNFDSGENSFEKKNIRKRSEVKEKDEKNEERKVMKKVSQKGFYCNLIFILFIKF